MKELTIIIPCLNEESFIEGCLKSIIESDYNKNKLEILIYDGGSTDNTQQIVKQYSIDYLFISLRFNTKRITPVAFNLGITETASEFVMILGAHSRVAPDYFSKCVSFLKKNKDYDVVGGLLKNKGTDKISEAIAKAMSSVFGVGGAHFRTGFKSGQVNTVAFGVYRKSIFKKVGLFNEKLIRGQDGEMNHRIKKEGGKIYLLNNTYVEYFVRSSFSKLFKQYFQYGCWKMTLNIMNKSFVSIRQIVPSLFVGLVLLILLSFFLSKEIFVLGLVVLIIYFIIAVYSSIKQSKSILKIIYILISFFILHLSYGIGYFYGLYNYIHHKKS